MDLDDYSNQELEDGARILIGDSEKFVVETLLEKNGVRPQVYVNDGPTTEPNIQRIRGELEEEGIIETVKDGKRKSIDSLTEYGAAVVKYNNDDPRFEDVDINETLEPSSDGNIDEDVFFEPLEDAKAFTRVGEYDKARQIASVYRDWGFPEQEEVVDAYVNQAEL